MIIGGGVVMRVKSFKVGVANGLTESLEYLDDQVNGLGNITNHSLADKYINDGEGHQFDLGCCPGPKIVRVVVYTILPRRHRNK